MTDLVYPGQTPAADLGSSLLPKNVNLTIYRGDYFPILIVIRPTPTGTPIDLTGYSAEAQIRPVYDATTHYDFVVDITPAVGEILIALENNVSESIPIGDYIWDFELTDPLGRKRTYLTGDVILIGDVTNV